MYIPRVDTKTCQRSSEACRVMRYEPKPLARIPIEIPPTVNNFPTDETNPFIELRIRSDCGLSLSSSYIVPHCGHLRAF